MNEKSHIPITISLNHFRFLQKKSLGAGELRCQSYYLEVEIVELSSSSQMELRLTSDGCRRL